MFYRNFEKLITLLVPCRERHDKTIDFLQSIENSTHDKSQIRVITLTDWNAPDDIANISTFYNNTQPSYELFNIVRHQASHLNKDYFNLAALLAESYYVWILGNDILLTTDGWDMILQKSLQHTFEDIANDTKSYYVYIDDDTHCNDDCTAGNKDAGSCFPIISTNYAIKTRGPMPADARAWGGDIILYHRCRADSSFEMIDLCTQIAIQHISIHNQKTESDSVTESMREREFLDRGGNQAQSRFSM